MVVDERLQRRDIAKRGQHEGLLQDSPFKPQGAFKTRRSMNVLYSIEPQDAWLDLSRYKSFVLNDAKHVVGDFVHVDNGSPDNCVAKILEIRASDERHVYARVYWMYSPHDLPGKAGRNRGHAVEYSQFYGRDEMIVSNHMDIISVLSIIRGAVVQQTYGEHDDAKSPCLYWRQALDYPTQEVSSINSIHEHINQAHESAPSEKAVRDEPPSIPEKQTSQQGRLKEGQQIPTVAGEAQLMRIDISNSRRIQRRHRRRCRGRLRKNTELNQWTFEMQKLNLFGKKRTDGVTTSTLLHSVANVRHTAVHRRRVSMTQIDKFFTDALALLGFFEAEEGRKAVVALRQEITTLLACGTNEQRELPGDSEFQVFPPIQGSKRVRLILVVNLEHIKRAAGDSEPKKFTFREDDILLYDPIIPALALAFSDGAFLNCFSSPEAIYNLKVPPNQDRLRLLWKEKRRRRPIFRGVENTPYGTSVSDTKALPYEKERKHLIRLGRSTGFEKQLQWYDLRRGSGKKINGMDCQSICFGSAPQQDLIHLAARLQRHDAAPTCLTEEQLAEVNELKALRHRQELAPCKPGKPKDIEAGKRCWYHYAGGLRSL
ncbi:hypothetical protein G3M48_009555 [Beauveria asiatica]|uniref:BAH domain-containing protein n=1 Tax=Beauveria asiatica TaxID=1069075 RepID=A0AAW0S319_9HYPO